METKFDYTLYISDENRKVIETAFFCEIENAVAYAKKCVRHNESYAIVATPIRK